MAFDEELGQRIRGLIEGTPDIEERKMFGGLAFMYRGHMAVGIVKDDLMVRVGPAGDAEALARPHVRPMDFSGKPMKGMVYVAPDGLGTDAELKSWIDAGLTFARSLPPRDPAGKRRRTGTRARPGG